MLLLRSMKNSNQFININALIILINLTNIIINIEILTILNTIHKISRSNFHYLLYNTYYLAQRFPINIKPRTLAKTKVGPRPFDFF